MKARGKGARTKKARPSLRSALLAFAVRCRALEAEGLQLLGELGEEPARKPRKRAA